MTTHFKPDYTPEEILKQGFGRTYFRPIYSGVLKKNIKDAHKEFNFNIKDSDLTQSDYDSSYNKYGIKVGSSLLEWENNGWIHPQDPYGWVQCYECLSIHLCPLPYWS